MPEAGECISDIAAYAVATEAEIDDRGTLDGQVVEGRAVNAVQRVVLEYEDCGKSWDGRDVGPVSIGAVDVSPGFVTQASAWTQQLDITRGVTDISMATRPQTDRQAQKQQGHLKPE